jgi:lipoprotein NlpI
MWRRASASAKATADHRSLWRRWLGLLPIATLKGCATRTVLLLASAVLLLPYAITAQSQAESARVILDRAISDFRNGRVAESVVGFDNVVRAAPDAAPQLWQRGIALYYAGRYKDCRAQFELHRTANPDDVENAAWHFLCVARAESPAAAKAALLPVGPDSRVPMRQVYEMLRGSLKPEDVLTAAGARPDGQFYAHLYVGLYFEALGNKTGALEHIQTAAAPQYAAVGGYMHDVAKIHLSMLGRK